MVKQNTTINSSESDKKTAESSVKISIFTDISCPWCFIGKRRLERALYAYSATEFILDFRVFFLNPHLEESGVDRNLYMTYKFGSIENGLAFYDRIALEGKKDKIDFRFDKIQTTPNTIKAHSLIAWASALSHNGFAAMAMLELLFQAYFFEGKDVGNIEILTDIYENYKNLHKISYHKDCAEVIETYRSKIIMDYGNILQLGITSVPFFIIGDKYSLNGAMPSEAFIPLIDLVKEEKRRENDL